MSIYIHIYMYIHIYISIFVFFICIYICIHNYMHIIIKLPLKGLLGKLKAPLQGHGRAVSPQKWVLGSVLRESAVATRDFARGAVVALDLVSYIIHT